MKTNGQSAYTGTCEGLPPWWGGYLSRNLFRVSHAPGYAPGPEQQPVCRQFARCEGCPYPIPMGSAPISPYSPDARWNM